KHWETWEAYRELHSNMLDERGTVYATGGDVKGEAGHTIIVVDGADFDTHYRERGRIFLQTDPIAKLKGIEVHPGESNHVYFRGIRAMDLNNPSAYTYNIIDDVTLTEDRTI